MVRVLCVEDDPMVRGYLEVRFTGLAEFDLVGSTGDAWEAMEKLRAEPIDVVLLDYRLGAVDGLQLLDAITHWGEWHFAGDRAPAVLFCTGYADTAFETMVRAKGAKGVVEKCRLAADLVPALRAVAAGGCWFQAEDLALNAEGEGEGECGGWWLEMKRRFGLSSPGARERSPVAITQPVRRGAA